MIKNKLQAYLKSYDNGYNNKHAIRYLSKRNPTLWKEIVDATHFIITIAKPKQRCWHILNDVYEMPKCPVTGEYVKWWENRYLTYISHKAKMNDPKNLEKRIKTYEKRTGHKGHWSSDQNIKEQKQKTYSKNRKDGKHKIVPSAFCNPLVQQKARNTIMEKYGVKNIMELKEFRDKLKDPQKSERNAYRSEVEYYTKLSWINYFDEINPTRIERGPEQHLDHIFSIHEGFNQCIPPEIVGHWTNLQMLSRSKNDSKNTECWKTKDQLLEDYDKYKHG